MLALQLLVAVHFVLEAYSPEVWLLGQAFLKEDSAHTNRNLVRW